jgi:hypothetical protein
MICPRERDVRRAYDGWTTGALQGVQPLLQGFRRSVVPIIGRREFNLFTEKNKLEGTIVPTIMLCKRLAIIYLQSQCPLRTEKLLIKSQ